MKLLVKVWILGPDWVSSTFRVVDLEDAEKARLDVSDFKAMSDPEKDLVLGVVTP